MWEPQHSLEAPGYPSTQDTPALHSAWLLLIQQPLCYCCEDAEKHETEEGEKEQAALDLHLLHPAIPQHPAALPSPPPQSWAVRTTQSQHLGNGPLRGPLDQSEM